MKMRAWELINHASAINEIPFNVRSDVARAVWKQKEEDQIREAWDTLKGKRWLLKGKKEASVISADCERIERSKEGVMIEKSIKVVFTKRMNESSHTTHEKTRCLYKGKNSKSTISAECKRAAKNCGDSLIKVTINDVSTVYLNNSINENISSMRCLYKGKIITCAFLPKRRRGVENE